jgi:hypothetical protein
MTPDFTTPGYARFTLSAPSALPPGTIKLVNLRASVPQNAPYAAQQVLDVMDVFVNGSVAALDDDGVQLVAYLGDANGDAAYSVEDAQRIERVVTGQDSGFPAYRNVDPLLVADVNRSGTVTLADATLVSQEVQYLTTGKVAFDRPEIPPIPAGIAPLNFGPASLAAIPASSSYAQTTPKAVIDLSGKLAAFSLDAANEDGLGTNGQSWKTQLAGNSTQADSPVNPNSKLKIPVTLAASKSVTKM